MVGLKTQTTPGKQRQDYAIHTKIKTRKMVGIFIRKNRIIIQNSTHRQQNKLVFMHKNTMHKYTYHTYHEKSKTIRVHACARI